MTESPRPESPRPESPTPGSPPPPPRTLSPGGKRVLVIVPLLLLVAVGIMFGPAIWEQFTRVKIWDQQPSVLDPLANGLIDSPPLDGQVLGWVEVRRFSGEPTGREQWWYTENGILARSRTPDGVTTYHDRSGTIYAQGITSSFSAGGFESSGVRYSRKPPWENGVLDETAATAPWVEAKLTPEAWWSDVETKE